MAWILVAESEGRFAERIRDGLAADGWQVDVVPSADAATAAAAARAPEMVIASSDLPGAPELLARFARRSGGGGAIALVPEMGGGDAARVAADEAITKPFSDKDLRLAVRRLATSGRGPRAMAPASDLGGERLTSKDLFGDVLAEMEDETPVAPMAPMPPVAPVPPPKASPPPVSAAARAASADVERALERTLSGLLKPEKPRAPALKKSSGVDDLISRTLSGLDVGERPKRSAAPAAPPAPLAPIAPSAAEPRTPFATPPSLPALPPLQPAAPLPPLAPPTPFASAPTGAAPPAAEPPHAPRPLGPDEVERMLAAARPPSAEVRRPSREIDLSQLDELARPRSREGARDKTPEGFATQRVALPSALRAKSSPTEFGQYTLLERIAVGGMAEVWKARMKGLEGFQKTVAIKKILPHLTDSSDFVTMFIDEAKLAAQLNHNNIIHIYDLGKLGDDYYIAMEFVDGKDLRSILNTSREKTQPLPMGLALLVASRLASALDHAHHQRDFEGREMGLVHRDVSPQNVLISFEGDIKLCDFGIVKAVAKASKTQMGALKGKLQYMSPEQAWGRPVDSRSDIFSLGSLLFEMLTGRRLFAGDSEMSVLDAVREGRIQAPRDLDPRLPLEVNNLALRALAKDPADRFASAGEMGRELESILLSLKPTPSPQDLAAYLKRLFGVDGRTEAVPVRAAAPAVPTAPPALAPPSAPAHHPPVAARAEASRSGVHVDEALEAAPGRSQKLIWIAAAAALVLGVGAYLLFARRPASEAPQAPDAPASATSESPSEAGAAPVPDAAASSEPAAAAGAAAPQVAQLVGDELKKREEELKRRYEEELRRKQQEVAAASASAQPAAATPAPAAGTEPEPGAAAADSTPAATSDAAAEPAASPVVPETAPEPPAPAPAAPAPVEPAPAVAPEPVVREGDLVRAGPGVKPPTFVSIDKPEYPPIARRMKVEGTVVLSLLVDETGRVADVRLERGVQQNVGINEAALKAARTARFQPATQGGVRVKMWYQLTIPFKL